MKYKLLFLVTLVLSCFQLKADETETDQNVEIISVEYDYRVELPDKVPWTETWGTLRILAKVPNNTTRVVINRSRPHIKSDERIIFLIKSPYEVSDPFSPIEIIKNSVNWGTYFQIEAYDSSDNITLSPLFCSSDYVAPEDMEKILNNASIEEIDSDNQVNLSFENKILTVDASSETQVAVYDITGKTLYNGNIIGFTSIPIQSNFIIVRYSTNNQVFTKKIISK